MIPFRRYLPSILILLILGWGGLAFLLIYTFPTVWPRWTFYFLWVVALTGTALPFAYVLNRLFPTHPPAESSVPIRQAIWVGIYGATLAWLQLGRLVSLWVILGLAGGLVAIEYFIRLRELARRRPVRQDESIPDLPLDDKSA